MKRNNLYPELLQFLDISFWKNRPRISIGMLALNIVLALGIWVVDISTEIGVAVGVLYVFVVLFGSSIPYQYAPTLIAVITSGLVLVGGVLSPPGGEDWKTMTNRMLSLVVIWGTALLINQYRDIQSIKLHEAFLEKKIQERTQSLLSHRAHLRKLSSQLTLVEQRERRSLATDLHDYLAQLLVLCHMKTQKALASPQKQMRASELVEVDALLDKALLYTRNLVAELSPTILYDVGLAPALKWLGEQMSQHGLTVHVKDDPNLPMVAEDQAVFLYLTVRELLFNILKHAETDSADIFLKQKENKILEVTVCDYGKGYVVPTGNGLDTGHKTFGLLHIRERIEAMAGKLNIESKPNEGTKVVVMVPLQGVQDSHPDYPQISTSVG